VLKFGIANYNEECRSIVQRYSQEWKKTVTRIGRWIDFENDYKTMDPHFMESIWWVFKTLNEKNLVYKGFKVMPYSTACNTPLSNFEAGLDYRDVSDPAIMVTFPVIDSQTNASLVAWTTTPWTLPSNVALCVNPDLKYVYVKNPKGDVFIVAESRLHVLPQAMAKGKEQRLNPNWSIEKTVLGKELDGLKYKPLFKWYGESVQSAFRVCVDSYVKDDSGTGVVHQAPAYGEDDYRVCLENQVVLKGDSLPDPVDANGCFMAPAPSDLIGVYVKDADKMLIQCVKDQGRLLDNTRIVHSYPFCWRSQTPLIYRAVSSFFIKVQDFKDRLIANNLTTEWVPSYVKEKRFHNWLESAHDWSISRNRYWGTPIPVWSSPSGDETLVIGSIAELEQLTGTQVSDIHRHFIDDLEIPSRRGPDFPPLRRVEDVFDCWFESGSMPYAQQHYPFENKEKFENSFPADFVAEGLDQTRGWFYTLMVLSTALFDRPAFKNLICNGLVLASDGKKMSKSLKNYPDPNNILEKYGADALRLYLIDSPVVRAEPLRFKEEGVFSVLKDVFLPWYNAYRFLVQNVRRVVAEGNVFQPNETDNFTNVLDIWILSSTNSLVRFVRDEMKHYRLYTVVPRLILFISQLTNIYVRYNRARLKGKLGAEESRYSLIVLFKVLLTLCKTMAPFTPFFVENMYQNLRLCMDDAEESIHFCPYPSHSEDTAHRIEISVSKMQAVIEAVRALRERAAKPLKMPLSSITIVDADADFLQDAKGALLLYITDELNVRTVNISSEPRNFASLKAEPNFSTLGKRLGKSMKAVTQEIKSWDDNKITSFKIDKKATVAGHELLEEDVIIRYEFDCANDEHQAHATIGEGGGMVILDLRTDASLVSAGSARLFVNKVQKLRKSVGLQTSDFVNVYYHTSLSDHQDMIQEILQTEQKYILDSLGCIPVALPDETQVVLGSDEFEMSNVSVKCLLCKPVASLASVEDVKNEDKLQYKSLKALILAREFDSLNAARSDVFLDEERVRFKVKK